MRFEEAMQALYKFKKIRRSVWGKKCWVRLRGNQYTGNYWLETQSGQRLDTFSVTAVLKSDWEVVEDDRG